MRKLMFGLFLMMALVLVLGCSSKESGEDASKEPAANQQAEPMDSTKMDSTMQQMVDTSDTSTK